MPKAKQPETFRWFRNGPHLRVMWEDGTITNYGPATSRGILNGSSDRGPEFVEAAIAAYAEFQLGTRTLQELLMERTAFKKEEYDEP